MKTRRHHNNHGLRQIKRDVPYYKTKKLAEAMGISMSVKEYRKEKARKDSEEELQYLMEEE